MERILPLGQADTADDLRLAGLRRTVFSKVPRGINEEHAPYRAPCFWEVEKNHQ